MNNLTGITLLRTIIPDEFAEQLCLISSNWRKDKFLIGDIRNSLKAIIDERLLPIATPDIDEFLAGCLNHEIEPRTIHYYALISSKFGDPVREEFGMLPHSHFALAQSFGDKWRSILELSRDRENVTGRAPSVAWLQAAQSGYIYEQQSQDFQSRISQDEPELMDDINIPEVEINGAKPLLVGWMSGLKRIVEFALKHLDAVPIGSDTRGELFDLLSRLDTILVVDCGEMIKCD